MWRTVTAVVLTILTGALVAAALVFLLCPS